MKREFTVVAIHGEGDRDTVNALQAHRNKVDAELYQRAGNPVPDALVDPPDMPPDIVIVLRDTEHRTRLEWPVQNWKEVDEWKKLAGYDNEKRHWKHGAKVKVSLGG